MDLSRGFPAGYGLVILPSRIIGTKKIPWSSGIIAYLGPGSRHTEDEKAKAIKIATELIGKKEFDFEKQSIVRIAYRSPGYIFRGHIAFKTTSDKVELKIANLTNAAITERTVLELIYSLMAFAPDRLYDETTGALMKPGTRIIHH
jgi:hypothetical protein